MSEWYVDASGDDILGNGTLGNPYQTIQGAHNKVTTVDGDTIVLMDGTHSYSTIITLTKSVSLTSQSGTYTDTFVNFINKDSGISYIDDISNITISNITFTDVNTVTPPQLLAFRVSSSGSTKPTVWPTNIDIYGNKFNSSKDALAIHGENIRVYNNIFERNSGSLTVRPVLLYFLRGYFTFDGNQIIDNIAPTDLILLPSYTGISPNYIQFLHSKNGTITVTNNTVTYDGTSSNIMQLVKHERWNLFRESEDSDGLTAELVDTFRVNYYISNNEVYLTNNAETQKRLRPLILDATPTDDGQGKSVLNQIGFVYFENNLFSTTPGLSTGGVNEGYIIVGGNNNVTPDNLNTPTFFFRDNSAGIISVPFPRSNEDSSGNIYFTQRTTVTPKTMFLSPWVVVDTIPAPIFQITDNLFNLPVNMPLDISGLEYAPLYRTNVQSPSTGITTHPMFETVATSVDVSGLPVNTFKVIIGTAESETINSLWFFIRVFDITGAIVTDFSATPLTIQIATPEITGPTATVKLNGSTLTTTATEVSTGVYSFQLLANSEYLIEGFSEPPAPETPVEDRFQDRSSVEWRQQACILANHRVGRFPDYAAYIRSKRCRRCC